jgi:preprotein translocase SecE subunit
MATAVEPSSQPRTPNPQAKLALASLLGAVYVVMALAVAFYAIPHLWAQYVGPSINNEMMSVALHYTVEIAAVVGLYLFGRSLAGANPPRGLYGGIFLVLVAAAVIFVLAKWVGSAFDGPAGSAAFAVTAAVLVGLTARLFAGPRGGRWMVGLEEQGWFHTHRYKPALGQRVRRLTIVGILVIGATGIVSMTSAGTLPETWVTNIPFVAEPVTVMTNVRYVVPTVLILVTLWVAFRVVNLPTFAEFLIATEAEMNKVSWTGRRRLLQDTVVVLITTFLMTMFLLVVDLFWGWLLSQSWVGVLPAKATGQEKGNQVQEAKW